MILARNRAVPALAFSFALSAFGADGLFAQIKENLDLPFDAVGEQEEEEESPEVVVFYNTNLEGDGFFYAIDKSSSMSQGELPRAKQEVIKNIREFSDRVYFGIFFFDRSLVKFPSNGQPAKANAGMKGAAISFVNSTPGGSGSCCKEGLLAALRMANLCKARRKVIVYLGDGGGHCDGDEAAYLQQTLTAVASANVQRVKINTIGVLDLVPHSEQFLRNLASMNGGTYTRIN